MISSRARNAGCTTFIAIAVLMLLGPSVANADYVLVRCRLRNGLSEARRFRLMPARCCSGIRIARTCDASTGTPIRTFAQGESACTPRRIHRTDASDCGMQDGRSGCTMRPQARHYARLPIVVLKPSIPCVQPDGKEILPERMPARPSYGTWLRNVTGHAPRAHGRGLVRRVLAGWQPSATGSWIRRAVLGCATGDRFRLFRDIRAGIFRGVLTGRQPVLTGSWDATAILWDAVTAAPVQTSPTFGLGALRSIRRMARACSWIRGYRSGDLGRDTGHGYARFLGHTNAVDSVHSRQTATACSPIVGRVRKALERRHGRQIRVLPAAIRRVTSLAFTPDGSKVSRVL